MNINRIIVAAGAAAYTVGILLAWWALGAIDRTPLLFLNLGYAVALLAGSYRSQWIRRNIAHLMAVAIYSIQVHALYLIWENHLPASLVGSCSTIVLAPIATFGFAFQTLRGLAGFLVATVLATLYIGITADAPQVHPAVFILSYATLAGVCFVAATGQLRTLESLRTNSERQRALVDAIPDVVLRIARDGTVLDTSSDPSSPLGQTLSGATGQLEFASAVDQALAADGIMSFELNVARAGGESLPIEARMVKSGEGEVTAILRDMTDERATKARLVVADRMSVVGTLSAGIGHEINNPLTYVQSNISFVLDLIREAPPTAERDAQIVEALEDAAEGAERINGIICDLQKLVRPDEGDELEHGDACNALRFAARVARVQTRHHGTLDVQIPAHILVAGGEGKLSQLFLNLIMNAWQAFEGDEALQALIEVRADTSVAGQVTFEVRDNGPGIPPEVQDRIFDAFFTTKEVGLGTGLGLYICHQIVADCGGELTIESEVGRGTTARVRLRRLAASGASAKSAELAPERLRILVVDDEPAILRMCQRLLPEHEVTICAKAPVALKLICADDYDAIICDMMMPVLNGMELFESVEIDEPEKAGRMVFISGGASRADLRSFLEAHADRYLPKPFDRASLLEALQRALRPAA